MGKYCRRIRNMDPVVRIVGFCWIGLMIGGIIISIIKMVGEK